MKKCILCSVNSFAIGNQSSKNYLLRIVLRALRAFRVFFALRVLRLPPLNTVTGGTTTPVWGSNENLRGISIKPNYLLRVALRPLRVFLEPLRVALPLRLPPFKGMLVDHPIPPGQLHQTWLC